ncbi:LAME_0C06172g1_1 [Lachancea meyersii CBS 8951]|uniref:LAME_0C06172g1_1 n=1 Tax=Lachancea meyersii CBS 8951 TaxID=1266667 RepID=A0A1G4J2E3_9SACH|nr:LAME_0C06172g1_1 [Lachancea meyersii CBS 8951]
MVDQSKLQKWGNPRLVSDSRCNYYPTSYGELNAWLKCNYPLEVPGAGPTALDLLDAVLYAREDGELDLEHKLRAEYAMFKASSGSFKARAREPQEDSNGELASLVQILGSLALDEGKLEALWRLQRDFDGPQRNSDSNVAGASRSLQQSQLEEVTSYLLSSALQRDIQLKPPQGPAPHDDIAFFKQCIDALMNIVDSKPMAPPLDHNTTLSDDTATALRDLQLAHSFLTKKFENDRNEYLHSIDKLNRTNKELSRELAERAKQVATLEDKCKSLKQQREILTTHVENLPVSTPVSSPSSNTSNGNMYSIGSMRAEFKKVLTEARLKHEEELERERSLRKRLEKELDR